ncbi:AEC family transporter [Xanthobacter oligotrophicus]|uniref:AEC family transporter n=1 Tax=Xanthobacter oligotrophicus TaxID=2607286 RepID=UPI0011F2F259|nr:AEC family transporter [Xanthobacter oligotrophicus]MCG5237295.1 AEC family transporter [Xanthobacter oligotrophicus]
MSDLFGLAFPFFGLIFLGYFCGWRVRLPESGLAWLTFFVIYVALPALFYRIVAQTPIHELANPAFILAVVASTATTSIIALGIGLFFRRGHVGEAAIALTIGAYANVGYMGPGLTLAALGQAAATPAALIFACDSLLFFTVVPLLMTMRGRGESLLHTLGLIAKRVFTHPFNIATMLGVIAAALEFREPEPLSRMLDFLRNAAAPCALFALGVTVALRPLKRVPVELGPLLVLKLVLHPMIALVSLSLFGPFSQVWTETLLLMAALPPALNVFVLARQYHVFMEEASAAVLLGTLFSVVTVTGMLFLLRGHLIPLSLF